MYWTGTDFGVRKLSIPGDRSTGTGTSGGAYIHLYPSDGGSIPLSGRTTENFDTGDFSLVGRELNFSFDFCDLFA